MGEQPLSECGPAEVQGPVAAPSIARNTAWTLVGNLVYGGCQWGMLVAVSRLGNAAMVGRFVLAVAICIPVFEFFNMGLRVVLATDARGDHGFGEYLGLRLATTVAALLVAAGIAQVGPYARETALAVQAFALARGLDAASDVFYGLFQQRERLDCIARSLFLRGVSSLGALALLVHATGSLLAGIAGIAGAWAFVLACHDVPTAARLLRSAARRPGPMVHGPWLRPQWEPARLGKLALLAVPLGAASLLMTLSFNVPRYLLERHSGVRELGIFGAVASLMLAGNALVAAMGASAGPRLAMHHSSAQRAAFRALLLKLVVASGALGALGILVALLAGGQVLALLFGPEYAAHATLFAWLMVAATLEFVNASIGWGISARRAFRRYIAVYLVVLCASAGASVLLIPAYGLLGAAWAMCLIDATCLAMLGTVLLTTRS